MSRFYHLGILGYPLTHSLSPRLHSIFLKKTGLQGEYKAFDVAQGNLSAWLKGEDVSGLNGFNITIPYKTQVIPYLNGISDEARLIGAVNTVLVKEKELYGENTDAYGFWAPLAFQDIGNSALVLGAGGSSRAVAYALLKGAIERLTFWVRNPERAAGTLQAVQMMNESLRGGESAINTLCGDLTPEVMQEFTMVVNTTPVGMYPNSEHSPLSKVCITALPPNALVYDLVYNPLETQPLKLARDAGLKTQDGLDMLIHQGAKAFELWTGQSIPPHAIDVAREELLQSLTRHG